MKRKLNYKKILIAVGVLTATAALSATVTVGVLKATKSKPKKDLNLIISKTEVNGNKFNTEQTVLAEIINLNQEVSINDIEIKNFKAASEGQSGTAEIHAKANSKYKGQVNITITVLWNDKKWVEKIHDNLNVGSYWFDIKNTRLKLILDWYKMGILDALKEKALSPKSINANVYYAKMEINYIFLKWQNRILTKDDLRWTFNSGEIWINFNFGTIKNQTIDVNGFEVSELPPDPNLP